MSVFEKCEDMKKQLIKVRKSYERLFSQDSEKIPPQIAALPGYDLIMENLLYITVGAPEVRTYLNPTSGMNFIDLGCSGDLAQYQLEEWPSLYYGIDISPLYINVMKLYARQKKIKIGGLFVGELINLPFKDSFFEIAACIGVTQYLSPEYLETTIKEIARVLKKRARLVIDIPNKNHEFLQTMLKVEEYYQRPNYLHSSDQFLEYLKLYFKVHDLDDQYVLKKYYLERY